MAISPALADVYLTNPDGIYFIEAIDIAHPALANTLHFTNASFDVVGLLDNAKGGSATFKSLPFAAVLPEKNTQGNQQLQLSVSNITNELIDDILLMTDAPQQSATLEYRVFLTTQKDGSGAHINQLTVPWRYEISSVNVTAEAVTMSATKINTHNKSFPRIRYRRTTFPGLSR